MCVVQQADSARFARRPRLSIMKLHRIKQTRGSAPPLSLSLSPCLYHFMSSLLLDRVCVGQTCTGAPIDFPIIGWQGGGGERKRRERDTNACIHENTREAPVSLAPCDLNTALCHGIPSRYTRAVPPWNVLHVHKCRTCTIEGKATCHALCHTVSPSALSTYDASSSSPWGWLASLLSPPSPVCFSLCSLLDWMLRASSSRLITFWVGLVSLLGRSCDGQVAVCGKFSY